MELLLSVLAVWKISAMLMDYDGPLNIIKVWREFIDSRQRKHNKFLLNFDCMFCISVIIAAPFTVMQGNEVNFIINWFGISGAAWLLDSVIEWLRK